MENEIEEKYKKNDYLLKICFYVSRENQNHK